MERRPKQCVTRSLFIPLLLVTAALLHTSRADESLPAAGHHPTCKLSVVAQGLQLIDRDMRKTYGHLAAGGLRLALLSDRSEELFLTVMYGADSGDPFYGIGGPTPKDRARLTVVPIQLGYRQGAAWAQALRLHAGIGLQAVWIDESAHGEVHLAGSEPPTYTGWGAGAYLLAGPEWYAAGKGLAVGLECQAVGCRARLTRGGLRRPVDLSGVTILVYMALDL